MEENKAGEAIESFEESSPKPDPNSSSGDKNKAPEVEVHLFRRGRGPIDVFRSKLGGWDQDRLEVQDILDKYGFKSLFAFNPESGRGVPIRFSSRNGRSVLPYTGGSVVVIDGEPKDSLVKPVTKIMVGVAVLTLLIAMFFKETPEWFKSSRFSGITFPPWVLACMVIVFTRLRKRTKDVLKKYGRDYQTDHKVTVTTCTSNGVEITASGTRKNDLIFGEIQSHIKNKNVTFDVKTNSDSNVTTTITIDELASPGLKTIFSFVVPDQRSGKVEIQYLHDYTGINASIGLTANPVVNLSGAVGSKTLSVGADVAFDTATGKFIKYNAGLSITNADLIAALTLNNRGDSLSASYYHLVKSLSRTAVGAELTHSFSSNENTLTFGTQHALDRLTTVKGRINSYGKASALIQHEWKPKSFLTISGEIDTKAIEKSSKVGLSLVLKP
ncbi:hypothetical protein C4D60_Mb03t21370 [Musa balbisiana]|uniref:Uncharacterized protein n=1 Tax=Musa balbisiana TaxID=52838 RepID=A0A4S8JDA1_MUSBA|nr:hypothetical protein C4D60_Mb03t21370 [Musa balbisiana]